MQNSWTTCKSDTRLLPRGKKAIFHQNQRFWQPWHTARWSERTGQEMIGDHKNNLKPLQGIWWEKCAWPICPFNYAELHFPTFFPPHQLQSVLHASLPMQLNILFQPSRKDAVRLKYGWVSNENITEWKWIVLLESEVEKVCLQFKVDVLMKSLEQGVSVSC